MTCFDCHEYLVETRKRLNGCYLLTSCLNPVQIKSSDGSVHMVNKNLADSVYLWKSSLDEAESLEIE